MKIRYFLSESALKLSQYRKYHKLAKEYQTHSIYDSLFKHLTGNVKSQRAYYGLSETEPKTCIVPAEVREQLLKKNIILEDYLHGLGTDSHGRTVKIGKHLT